jgi:hypothetical protein
MAVVSSTVMPQIGSLVTEFDCFMVYFPFSVVVAPAGQGYGHSPWRTTCLSPFCRLRRFVGFGNNRNQCTRSANLLLPGCDVSDEQQRHRMGCRRYRKANPALSVTKLTCAMGHLALLPASTTLRGCGSALQHPLPAPLPRRPRQAVGDGARRAQANKPRQVCAIEYARQRELQT